MKFQKTQSPYVTLVKIFIGIAMIGVGALLYTGFQHEPSEVLFSLIAFAVSVIALVMTTLQSISIARQVKITEKAARLVHETGEQLEELVEEDRKLAREIRQDIKLDHEIIAALEEMGIGESHEERQKVASHITRKVSR